MKDLLADLQVDDGDFSLDQLEKELATLDHGPPQLQSQPLPALDAASLVVSHAQERAGGAPAAAATAPNQQGGADAWSLSLQNFTAMSLQEDFLAADSARKKQQAVPLQPVVLEGAEDYDIGEKVAVAPPPGLGTQSVLPSKPPQPRAFPKTPQNSGNIGFDDANFLRDAMDIVPTGDIPSQDAPRASEGLPSPVEAIPSQGKPEARQQAVPPQAMPMPISGQAGPYMPGIPAPGVTPMMAPHAMLPQPGMPMSAPQMMTPHGPGQPFVVAAPAMRGPAWQTPRASMPQPVRAYCDPHPSAHPIPATALETKYMSARDIAYVVHAILKPVLAEGVGDDDYYIQILRRLGNRANPSIPNKAKDMNEEMSNRAHKSKEWSSEKGTLGHVTKSNVARPRALIATPVTTKTEQDSEQKQRATLWKARIYCDQAYQAYQTVVDIWRSAPPGAFPPQVQMHLVKLMKCMGITHVDKDYQVDQASLSLLIKLSKGRTLTARVMEQALLPPNAVQSLLPVLLDSLLSLVAKKNADEKTEDMSVERVFRAVASVVHKLNTSSDTLLKCLEAIQKNGKSSLGSPARMECAHTLLQKGSMVVGQGASEEQKAAWGRAESDFMNLL